MKKLNLHNIETYLCTDPLEEFSKRVGHALDDHIWDGTSAANATDRSRSHMDEEDVLDELRVVLSTFSKAYEVS